MLEKTSENTDKADLRDRAFIYWRILNEDIGLAKEIILGARPASNPVHEESFDEDLIHILISDIGFLNSIFYCTVESLPLHKIKQQVYQDTPNKGVTSNSIRASTGGEKSEGRAKDKSPQKSETKPEKKVAAKADKKDMDVFAEPSPVKPTKKSIGKPPNKEQSMGSKEVDIFADDDILGGGGSNKKPAEKSQPKPSNNAPMDLLDMDLFGGAPTQPAQGGNTNQPTNTGADDIFGDLTGGGMTGGMQTGENSNNQKPKTDDIFDLF